MLSPAQGLALVLKRVRPLEAARRALGRSLGCRLAEDVVADRDMPPADRSAMDGYAVRAADVRGGSSSLRLIGEVAAGSSNRPRVTPGTCVRILTGANVPPGADSVVMVEQTRERGRRVTISGPVERGANIFRRGEDARKGAILLRKGTQLGPLQIGVCAAVGRSRPKVHRPPRIGFICTGRELRDAAERVRPHEVRNSNGPALCAAVEECGCEIAACRSGPDNLRRLTAALRQVAGRCDLVALTGGVSVGRYDYVREAVERIGAAVRFHGVAMKPGKPLLYATLPGNRHIFGLPGNPLSAMTGFYEFVLPALRRLAGAGAECCRPVLHLQLNRQVVSRGGRLRFMPARILWTGNGPRLEPVVSHSSADLVSGGLADGVIAVPAEVTLLRRGAVAEFRPWRPLP
jgi:molybdopterin molybdotransferase